MLYTICDRRISPLCTGTLEKPRTMRNPNVGHICFHCRRERQRTITKRNRFNTALAAQSQEIQNYKKLIILKELT